MRRHKLLIWTLGASAVVVILSVFWNEIEQLIIHGGSIIEKNGLVQNNWTVGKPKWEILPVLWRSGNIKSLFRSIMIGFSFFGGIRIGILLLNNREKLNRIHCCNK